MTCIYINDSTVPYTDMILNGEKTVETRHSNTLGRYAGQIVAIVRTGKGYKKIVGFMRLRPAEKYESYFEFDIDRCRHRVPAGSKHDFKDRKYGYYIESKLPCTPILLFPSMISRIHGRTAVDIDEFLLDPEKMYDFCHLSKDEFLDSYSYLTEQEYENTRALAHAIKGYKG